MLILPAAAFAADYTLLWDPNCNQNPYLEGYTIYFKEDASVVEDRDGAFEIYVDLSDPELDSDNPGHTVIDLEEDTRYCFTVTAWYEGEESGMSNELCGINGRYDSNPDSIPPNTDDPSIDTVSTDSSGGGCFMGMLK
jgi:hypothetical protein